MNEFLTSTLFCLLFVFTNFIPDRNVQYQLGFLFDALFGLIIMMNISITVYLSMGANKTRKELTVIKKSKLKEREVKIILDAIGLYLKHVVQERIKY